MFDIEHNWTHIEPSLAITKPNLLHRESHVRAEGHVEESDKAIKNALGVEITLMVDTLVIMNVNG